jgi:hypothetical protein
MSTTIDREPATAEEREPEPAAVPTPAASRTWLDRLVAPIRYAWPALAAYIAVRAVGLGMFLIWIRTIPDDFAARLARGDAGYYFAIATQGYDSGTVGVDERSTLAFFPLYPQLIAAAEHVLPYDIRVTSLVVAWAASLAAAWGIFAVGAHVAGRRAGIMLAALWGVVPHAIVANLPYTEGLFTAFAAWTLWAVLKNRWLTAGVLCVLAGLTRPTASALVPVVCLAALVAIFKRRNTWRPYVALALAPAGWVGYLWWVGERTGRIDGWFHIQSAQWKMTFDGGVTTVRDFSQVLARESAFELMLVALTLVVAVGLFVLSIIDRQPWQLLLFSALMLFTAIGAAGYFNARARFLLPAFALLLPPATALAKGRTSRAYVVLGTLAVISAYIGCYLVLIWKYSP